MFDSLGSRRPRRRVPGWLWLLVGGLLAGAAGVIAVQERYLPPRLSAGESAALRQSYEQADGDRLRLKAELVQSQQRLQAALADKGTLGEELASSRAEAERLREDLASVVQALPPDPRGGSVEVRAGQFNARGGELDYQVVLWREGSPRKPLTGVMQFNVAGESAGGTPTTLALKPIALNLGSHEVLRGSLPLPEGFKPRQTTVQVLDRTAGKLLGMRVLLVR
ncbi:MAG: putative inner rane protein [Proteobacteria bacterium]|jgi:hypothetical protein|nr:putative inner rane protein [Pseudomonadota bacterium]